jgi:GTP cyclohydrolase I
MASNKQKKVTQVEAEEAIKTLLLWIGEDVNREGLLETPSRVIKAYAEKFQGYKIHPQTLLSKQFSETAGYKGIIVLSNIAIESTCEHHLAPIIGTASVGYIPRHRVVGISKLARVVEAFANRLQLQERLTAEIAHTIQDSLHPLGVAVTIKAKHHCICYRGVNNRDTEMVTSSYIGRFETEPDLVRQFAGSTSR